MTDTIENLEQDYWGEPTYGSHLVSSCHELRKKSISRFTPSDLRIMIGQDIGTQYLMPKALGILFDKPLISATFFEGDLLRAILKLPTEYWEKHPEHLAETLVIAEIALNSISSIREELKEDDIRERARQFTLYGAKLEPIYVEEEHKNIEEKVREFIKRTGTKRREHKK